MKINTRMAVISDLHYTDYETGEKMQGSFADALLLRVVHRLNRWIKPDIVLLPGDLLHEPKPDNRATQSLLKLRQVLDKLQMPWIVIPGNHDPAPEIFYQVMPEPPEYLDIGGVRFLPFIDQQTEGYNACRSQDDLNRMLAARHNHAGAIVTLQHVPLFPPQAHACPYHYENAQSVIEAMRKADIKLAVSGHYHSGFNLSDGHPANFIAAPALCKPPYQFLSAEIINDQVVVKSQALANPPLDGLTDYHVHTPYAYCSENMDICKTLKLGRMFGLQHLVFSEHSGQLYHLRGDYWSRRFLEPDAVFNPAICRLEDYFADLAPLNSDSYALAGLEVDCDYHGQPVIRPEDRTKPRAPIGAIHFLPGLAQPNPDPLKIQNLFMRLATDFVRCGIVSLAHPLRLFHKAKLPLPTAILEPLAELLRVNKVAAELNFHTNQPDPEFFKMCLARGVKIAFGSDAHNLYEIGEFYPHLNFLRHSCGYDGDLKSILLDFEQVRNAALNS